jgi:hypothetical protein
VYIKSMVFWVVISRSSEKGRHFGEIYGLCLQGFIVSKARNQQEPGNKPSLASVRLYCDISQNRENFKLKQYGQPRNIGTMYLGTLCY